MKQLLSKIIPKFIIEKILRYKYRKYNTEKHKENIENNRLVKVQCTNKEKYSLLKVMLRKSFNGFLNIDKNIVYFHPIAIIKVPENIDMYLKEIGAKSRNMNVKAKKNGISCNVFNWNEYLADIYEVNRSSTNRQGRKMDDAYMEYPEKMESEIIKDFSIVVIGAFVDKKLVGYVELYIYGNFTMTNRILGHKDYLKYGIMNLLIKECVEYAIESRKIEFINYLTMQNRENNSLSAFKKRVGFREYSLKELL